MTPRVCMQVFCQEQPSRDSNFYRSFVAADYTGLWAHYEHARQRHLYEAGTLHVSGGGYIIVPSEAPKETWL